MGKSTLMGIFIIMLIGAPRTISTTVPSSVSRQIMKLDSLLDRNPRNIETLVNLGQAYRQIGIAEEAERFFQKAFSIAPDNATVNFAPGEVALEKGNYEQAKIVLGKCSAIDPGNTECLNALAEIAFTIDKDKSSAKRYYERVLAIDPKNEMALLNSGVLLIELGDTSTAVSFLEKYVSVYPDSIRGRMNLGLLYDKTNRFHDALVQFSRVITLDDKHLEALQSLGVLYFKRKVYIESNIFFEKALKLSASIPISVALALGYHYEKEPDKALAVLDKAFVQAKDGAYLLRLLMADIAFVSGKHEAAIEYCKMAHELKANEHVEQKIVNAVYQDKGMNASVLLHDDSVIAETPLYEPGSIIKIFCQGLGN